MDEVQITIQHCPFCPESHNFLLNVDRPKVYGIAPLTTVNVKKRVWLTCPTKNQKFIATIELPETSGSKIKRVTEKGPVIGR